MLLNLEAVGTSWDLKWVNCRTKRGGLQGRNGQVSEVDTGSNTLFSFAQKWSKRRWEGILELLLPPLSYNYSSSILRWQTVGVCAYKMSPRSRRLIIFRTLSVFFGKGGTCDTLLNWWSWLILTDSRLLVVLVSQLYTYSVFKGESERSY